MSKARWDASVEGICFDTCVVEIVSSIVIIAMRRDML
jgi:hypothetical protein